ncbi:MAG: PDZ domain-containing protein [Gemmatimonadota bacterium]
MKLTILRVLIPMLGLVGLALVVQGVSAQETPETDASRARVLVRAPTAFSFSTNSGTYLGVFIREVTAEDAERLGLSEERGALIADMPDEGPASEAGLQTDDVIVSWNGSRIESAAQLRRMVRETPGGRSIDIGYVRDGRERTVSVELADRSPHVARFMPQMEGMRLRLERLREGEGALHERLGQLREFHLAPTPRSGGFQIFMRGGRLGIGIQNLGDQLAKYFGADDGGVLVTSVNEESPAEAAGLRAGDVIIGVGDASVEDPGDLMEEIGEAEEGEIEIRILRDRSERKLRATLPERQDNFRSGNAVFFGPEAMGFSIPFGDDAFVFDWNDGELLDIQIPDFHFDFEMPDIEIPDLDIDVTPYRVMEHGAQT